MIGKTVAKRPYMYLPLKGDTNDYGTGGNNPSNTGVTTTTGQFGESNGAYEWADNSDRLSWSSSIGNTLAGYINNEITVLFFSKPKATINFASYFNQRSNTSGDNSFTLNQYNLSPNINQIRMNTNTTGSSYSTLQSANDALTPSSWQFVAMTSKDNTTDVDFLVYVNDTQVISSNLPYSKTDSSLEFRVGARNGDNTLGDLGDLSSYRIYDVTLSDGQIKIINNEKGRIRA